MYEPGQILFDKSRKVFACMLDYGFVASVGDIVGWMKDENGNEYTTTTWKDNLMNLTAPNPDSFRLYGLAGEVVLFGKRGDEPQIVYSLNLSQALNPAILHRMLSEGALVLGGWKEDRHV